jgi:hypothetical protein
LCILNWSLCTLYIVILNSDLENRGEGVSQKTTFCKLHTYSNQQCLVDQSNIVTYLSHSLFPHIGAGLNHVLVVSWDGFHFLSRFLSSNTICTTSTYVFYRSLYISRIDGSTRQIIVVDSCM